MNMLATVPTQLEADMSLAALFAQLDGHDERALSIAYDDRSVQPGYHITEVKAGSYATLDCGGNPDAWQETVLQVEDIPAEAGRPMMTAGKFRRILDQVDRRVRLNRDARLTIEIGRPGEAMRVFDVASVSLSGDTATLLLEPRAAVCKPRHRAQTISGRCCDTSVGASACR